jgi:hypothetical protein
MRKPRPNRPIERAENGQFILGHAPAPGCGRPRGTRPKLAEAFIAELHADFLEHGVATIEKVRQTRPAQYLQLIASILPRDVNVSVSAVESMSDDELSATIRRLSADPGIAELFAIAEIEGDQEFEGSC